MFEYHGNNLKIDTDGVYVTVALAEPLDIEKPLADLDLTTSKVEAVSQFVISRDELPPYMDARSEDDEAKPSNDYHFFNGYTSSSWSEGIDYEGEGNAEVIARAVPFLELGVKGLMAFCSQESQVLRQWLEDAHVRSDELRKIAQERAEAEAAELERIMPKRDPAIAFEELKQFAVESGMKLVDEEIQCRYGENPLWRDIDGRKLKLDWITAVPRPGTNPDEQYPGKEEGFTLYQHTEGTNKYNNRLAFVAVSERGYFAAIKERTHGQEIEFSSPTEALEALTPWILEGEEDEDMSEPIVLPVNILPGLIRGKNKRRK